MKAGWRKLLDSVSHKDVGAKPYASLDWSPHPMAVVNPKGKGRYELFDDGVAAYAHALAWVITGKQAHADKAIEIFNAWSPVFQDIVVENGDVYPNLYTSWCANNWAAAAEIIRHYQRDGQAAGWQPADIARFEGMCRVFERLSLEWIGYVGGFGGNQNQGTSTARTRLALGIFLDDQALFDTGLRLLFEIQFDNRGVRQRHGHPVNLVGLTVAADGEIMEFNRDAPHGVGSFNSLVNAAEILRHQQLPARYHLYEYKLPGETMPRLVKGSEFYARSYLQGPIAITTRRQFYHRVRAHYPEMLCNYYDHLAPQHYPLPLTHQVVEVLRPQPSSVYCPGWTTLSQGDLSANDQER
jgi:hypothetical protein